MKRRVSIALLVVMLVGIAAAASEVDVEIVDQTGATVSIDQPVERIVSVYGIGTYYVYALGGGDRLVRAWYIGLKRFSQASDSMRRFEPRLEALLTSGDPSVEEMIALGAELILVDGSRHAAFADQMTDLGVPVIQYRVETPEALEEAMVLTGAALGTDALARAEAFNADFDRVLRTIAADLSDPEAAARPRVLFLGTDPLKVASGEMFQTRLIEAAGGVSVSRDLTGSWNEVSIEQILVWDPEVIIIPPYGLLQPSDLLDDPDWAAIDAVKSGRVTRMPRLIGPMDTPVPEAMIGILWLAETFHPGAISLDLMAEIERFYATYYEFELTQDELERLLP